MESLLDQASRALQAGDIAAADAACRSVLAANPADARALQLFAMVQHRLGQLDQAEALFVRSVAIAPRNPEFRMNLALLLAARGRVDQSIAELDRALVLDPRLRPARLALARISNQAGRYAAADAHARKLIAADERDSEAWSVLGAARFAQKGIAEARMAFERAVAVAPRYGAARYGLAAVLYEEERALEAVAQAEEARRLGIVHQPLTLTHARALMQLDRYDEADALLSAVLAGTPHDVECQFLLAQLRHVRGDDDFARSFREAANRSDAPVDVRAGYGNVMRLAGRNEIAAEVLQALLQQHGPHPGLLSSLATVLQAMGRFEEAVAAARTAMAALPDDGCVAENYVTALLSTGAADQALPTIERFRSLAPYDQRWITYRTDVARQRGEALFDEWCDCERLVRVYDLTAPAGYSDMNEFHQVVRAVLETRHRQSLHPLDQSLRQGTQTSRSLLADADPVIKQLLAAFAEPLSQYQEEIARVPTHPFLARNTGTARLAGCWSVKLRRGGFHVNHIHPQGWVSSAYYVSVPEDAADMSARNGWLKLGEPRFPMPDGAPLRYVQPRPGRLVLFPSYFWHGTMPITTDEPRLTVAFDALPADRA